MIKNFLPKKGDQIGFIVTYPMDVDFSSVELGVKDDYTDEDFIIYINLGHGVTKVDARSYKFIIPTNNLDLRTYVYDLRTVYQGVAKTPLSGKIIVKDTVFNG